MAKKEFVPIGTGALGRAIEQGPLEIGGALYPDSNIAQAAGFRNFWTGAPNEARNRAEPEPEKSALDSRLEQAEARNNDKGKDDRGMDRE